MGGSTVTSSGRRIIDIALPVSKGALAIVPVEQRPPSPAGLDDTRSRIALAKRSIVVNELNRPSLGDMVERLREKLLAQIEADSIAGVEAA